MWPEEVNDERSSQSRNNCTQAQHMILLRGAALSLLAFWALAAAGAGDAGRGARLFQNCAACHSASPGEHMTGPSLAGVWQRKAGSAENFARYSRALKRSAAVWNEATLDAWLRDPAAFAPGNFMKIPGIADAGARSDLIAYLKATSEGNARSPKPPSVPSARAAFPDLRKTGPDASVAAIRHCGDSYWVTTASGKVIPYWEFNLRFKTDSSARGPARGKPVMVGAASMGDRAQVVFAEPREISSFITTKCE
ncbi:MAG: c-type cytochrome [Burkholderiales bacterium]